MEKNNPIHFLCLTSLCSLLLVAPSHQQLLVPQEDGALFTLWMEWGVRLTVSYDDCSEWNGNDDSRYLKCTCEYGSCYITYLDLSGASLNGSIPAVIGSFSMLTHLSLSRNNLRGSIPDELGMLTRLSFLDLSFNKLSGQIPPSFPNLISLRFLYLGSNKLTGPFPFDRATSSLEALDLSFNPINGSLEKYNSAMSLNILGTFVQQSNTTGRKATGIYNCLQDWSCCNTDLSYSRSQFAINCGGREYKNPSIIYYGDKEVEGTAFSFVDFENQWAVSNIGPGAPGISVATKQKINGTTDEELYKTAIMSPKSLRYFVFGLKNGIYSVDLHFAEIDDPWPQARLFDVYIQGERQLTDFEILKEAGRFTALVKSFYAHVNTSFIDIHFLQAARWNCCGPRSMVHGPLVSAINLTRVEANSKAPANPEDPASPGSLSPPGVALSGVDSSREALRWRGRISGIILLCTAIIFVASSVVYLWWIKDSTTGHIRIRTESPRS